MAAVTESPPTPSEQEGAPGDAAPLLVVDEVTVGFGGLLALDDVSMAVGHGEVVGVIGPNGAGKTTLFNVISGFVHPSSGTVAYRGASCAGTILMTWRSSASPAPCRASASVPG